MLKTILSNEFKRTLRLMKKRGKSTDELIDVLTTLANEKPLDPKYKDHQLIGNYSGA